MSLGVLGGVLVVCYGLGILYVLNYTAQNCAAMAERAPASSRAQAVLTPEVATAKSETARAWAERLEAKLAATQTELADLRCQGRGVRRTRG